MFNSYFNKEEVAATKYTEAKTNIKPKVGKIVTHSIGGLFLFSFAMGSFYTVDEGNVGIVKRFGEAINQTNSGLNFKLPFADSVEQMDVRTRKYTLVLSASTTGENPETKSKELQMPSQVTISANWSIPKAQALAVFKEYGSLEQYENKILDPKVTRSVKQVFPSYSIEEIISDRELVRNEVSLALTDALSGNLVTMTAVNLENVKFNGKIAAAVTKKQVAKLQLQEQRDILATQDLRAQESTNIDKAKANGIRAISIEKAAAVEREGLAEAKAIQAKAKALGDNPLLVELTKAQNWNGSYVTTLMGDNVKPLMDIRK